jgi:alkyl hydroperoxide reductase subunit AhpF
MYRKRGQNFLRARLTMMSGHRFVTVELAKELGSAVWYCAILFVGQRMPEREQSRVESIRVLVSCSILATDVSLKWA